MKIIENKHGVKIVETVYSKVMLRFIWNKDKGKNMSIVFRKLIAWKAKWF